jgi:hypothetical protein
MSTSLVSHSSVLFASTYPLPAELQTTLIGVTYGLVIVSSCVEMVTIDSDAVHLNWYWIQLLASFGNCVTLIDTLLPIVVDS